MQWVNCYSNTEMPSMEQIAAYISSPLWGELCSYLESDYGTPPSVQYSTCSGAPGWNVKYRKSGRSLCTLYPDDGFFTCLITIGTKETPEAELLLSSFSEVIQELYRNAKPMNGARWLMIPVTSPQILEDVKLLISLRMKKNKHA